MPENPAQSLGCQDKTLDAEGSGAFGSALAFPERPKKPLVQGRSRNHDRKPFMAVQLFALCPLGPWGSAVRDRFCEPREGRWGLRGGVFIPKP